MVQVLLTKISVNHQPVLRRLIWSSFRNLLFEGQDLNPLTKIHDCLKRMFYHQNRDSVLAWNYTCLGLCEFLLRQKDGVIRYNPAKNARAGSAWSTRGGELPQPTTETQFSHVIMFPIVVLEVSMMTRPLYWAEW